jgi:hypothetical protein
MVTCGTERPLLFAFSFETTDEIGYEGWFSGNIDAVFTMLIRLNRE